MSERAVDVGGRAAVVAVGVATALLATVPWFVSWASLPDPVATHWDLYGDPNGHLSHPTALAVLGGLAALLATSTRR